MFKFKNLTPYMDVVMTVIIFGALVGYFMMDWHLSR